MVRSYWSVIRWSAHHIEDSRTAWAIATPLPGLRPHKNAGQGCPEKYEATPDLVTVILAVVFPLVWTGAILVIDGRLRRGRRPPLAERLMPYRVSVSGEAEERLRQQ